MEEKDKNKEKEDNKKYELGDILLEHGKKVIIRKIICGYQHTFFISSDYCVWACGWNNNGQLGLGDTISRDTPTCLRRTKLPESPPYNDDVNDIYGRQIVDIICGGGYTFFIFSDNTIWSCGDNRYGQLGLGDTQNRLNPSPCLLMNSFCSVICNTVICGQEHTFFICSDNTIWSCGDNRYGQLGLGDTNYRCFPTCLSTSSSIPATFNIDNTRIVKIVCGAHHNFFIGSDNSIWTCGDNRYGQLGLGDTKNRHVPTILSTSSTFNNANIKILNISCGSEHSFFICSKIVRILCDDKNTFFICSDSDNTTIWSCGYNYQGQLGLRDKKNRSNPTCVPISISSLLSKIGDKHTKIVNIICGHYNTFFIGSDNSIWSCGDNAFGQLGLNDTNNRLIPTCLETIFNDDNIKIAHIVCGGRHTFFICSDDSIWGCGLNEFGQLGFKDDVIGRSLVLTPKCLSISSIFNPDAVVDHIVSDRGNTFYICSDKSGWACGKNQNGELGVGDMEARSKPTRILNDMLFDNVKIAKNHSFFLDKSGKVYCCGELVGSYPIPLSFRTSWPSLNENLIEFLFNHCHDIELHLLQMGNERISKFPNSQMYSSLNSLAGTGTNLLHSAVLRNDESSLVKLLNHKYTSSAVNAKTTKGWTPLHFAALTGNPRLVAHLLLNGVDDSARIKKKGFWKNEKKAIDIATDYNHNEIADMLLKWPNNLEQVKQIFTGSTVLHTTSTCE